MADLWVFGYGSLMWRPGFDYAEAAPARLHGEHRALCVLSFVHRGTREKPGLVLGLDKGGSCRGVVFRVRDGDRDAVLAYLRERELVTHVYHEVRRRVRLDDGREVEAVAYAVDRTHAQYAGKLAREAVLALVRESAGLSGRNRDYVLATAEHLAGAGIADRQLTWLAAALSAEGG